MKDFLAIADYSPDEIQSMLDLAVKLKKEYQTLKDNVKEECELFSDMVAARDTMSTTRGIEHPEGE